MIVSPIAPEPSLWTALLELVPVLAGAIIGALGTFAGTRYTSHLDERRQRRSAKRDKIESLVQATYALDLWMDQERDSYLFDGPKNTALSPMAVIESVTLLHCPELRVATRELGVQAVAYRKWMIDGLKQKIAAQARLPPQVHLDQFDEVYVAFAEKRTQLLAAARTAMEDLDE